MSTSHFLIELKAVSIPEEGRLEERLRAMELLAANGDHLLVQQLIALLPGGGGRGRSHLLLKVQGDRAELLLDVTRDFPLSGASEAVATLREGLHELVRQILASQVQMQDGMGSGGTPRRCAVWVTLSPESMTIAVVRPEAYRDNTAWMVTYMAGVLKVSNMV